MRACDRLVFYVNKKLPIRPHCSYLFVRVRVFECKMQHISFRLRNSLNTSRIMRYFFMLHIQFYAFIFIDSLIKYRIHLIKKCTHLQSHCSLQTKQKRLRREKALTAYKSRRVWLPPRTLNKTQSVCIMNLNEFATFLNCT